jgi:predicted nucleic acid-binding protein
MSQSHWVCAATDGARVAPRTVSIHLIVVKAMHSIRDHQSANWDAQIWASACLDQILVVFSEDFSDWVAFGVGDL